MSRLAAPLILAELGWMAMGVVDTMFVGRISPEAIGAVGLGTSLFYGVAVCASGLMYGLDTVVAQGFGAGNTEDCHRWLRAGMWLTIILTPLVMGSVWALGSLLPMFGVQPEVLGALRPYLRALIWSTPGLMLYFVLRRYIQALHLARPIMII